MSRMSTLNRLRSGSLAKASGVGCLGERDSGHTGRMGWWSNISNVMEDTRWLVVDMYVTDVLYQPRKGSGVAHALTQFGLKKAPVSFEWHLDFPPCGDFFFFIAIQVIVV
ncbi:unnamed protein product [Prunus armeniaca]